MKDESRGLIFCVGWCMLLIGIPMIVLRFWGIESAIGVFGVLLTFSGVVCLSAAFSKQ